MKLIGVDISTFQGNINFELLKNSTEFVILRLGYSWYEGGITLDSKFYQNIKGCIDNNIPFGIYIYAYDKSVKAAQISANKVHELLKPYLPIPYPIFYDIEDPLYSKMNADLNTQITKAFLTQLESLGYFAGLYTYVSFANYQLKMEELLQYSLWMAHYSSKLGYTKSPVAMWQYSSIGKVNGISTNVDMNECYVDYPYIIKKTGLNGYSKDPTSDDKLIDTPNNSEFEYTLLTDTLYKDPTPDGGNETIKVLSDKAKILYTCTAPIKVELENGVIGWTSMDNLKKIEVFKIQVGSKVKVKQGSLTYEGKKLASFVYDSIYTVKEISKDRVVISEGNTTIAAINLNDLILV